MFRFNLLLSVACMLGLPAVSTQAAFTVLNPATASSGQNVSTFFPGFTLSAVGGNAVNTSVFSLDGLFAYQSPFGLSDYWYPDATPTILRINLATPAQSIAFHFFTDFAEARLQAFNGSTLLGTVTDSASPLTFSASGNLITSAEFRYLRDSESFPPDFSNISLITINTLDRTSGTVVPVPATAWLMLIGLSSSWALRRYRR